MHGMNNPQSAIRNPQSWAFTLIELLVVVAIVAMLVAIAAPSLHRAADCAQAAVCAANLRGVAAGMILYEYAAEKFPPAIADRADGRIWYWLRLITAERKPPPGHVRNEQAESQVAVCPASPDRTGETSGASSYGLNVKSFCWARGHEKEAEAYKNYRTGIVTMEMVKRPGNTIMLGDGSHGLKDPGSSHAAHLIDTPGRRLKGEWMMEYYRREAPTQRHYRETIANLAYPDGHAAADGLASWDGSKQGAIWNYDLWVLDYKYTEQW